MDQRQKMRWKVAAGAWAFVILGAVAIGAIEGKAPRKPTGREIAMLAMASSAEGSDRYVLAKAALDSIEKAETGVTLASEPVPEPVAHWTQVSARDYYDAYQYNAVAADRRYKLALLAITGTVDKVDKTFGGDAYVQLQAGEILGVWAFTATSDEDRVSRLRPGDRVTLRCMGGGLTGSIPTLVGCSVSSRSADGS